MTSGTAQLRDLPFVLARMLRDPIETVRRHLDFSWPLILSLIALAALVSGAVAGAISHNTVDFILGISVFPLTSIATAMVFGFFIYYFFSLFRSTFLDFR